VNHLAGLRRERGAAGAADNQSNQRRLGKVAARGHMTAPAVDRQQPRGVAHLGRTGLI